MSAIAVGVGTPRISKDRGGCVACIMQSDVSKSSFSQQVFPFVVVSVRVQRAAVRFREYPVLVVPELAGLDALCVLD